ncbi:MAG: type II secretion system minor pseudopilin GspI, partial [Pseudomonadota bacterium]
MKRHPEDGFTLIEALVAMAILATAAISLLGAAEQHVSRINGLQDRILARWVAEDRLTARSLGLQESSETVELMYPPRLRGSPSVAPSTQPSPNSPAAP